MACNPTTNSKSNGLRKDSILFAHIRFTPNNIQLDKIELIEGYINPRKFNKEGTIKISFLDSNSEEISFQKIENPLIQKIEIPTENRSLKTETKHLDSNTIVIRTNYSTNLYKINIKASGNAKYPKQVFELPIVR